jgi:hypothetical protein
LKKGNGSAERYAARIASRSNGLIIVVTELLLHLSA